MTEPTFTYRPSPAQIADRIVALAAGAPAVNRAAREAVAAWDAYDYDNAGWARFTAAMDALREATR